MTTPIQACGFSSSSDSWTTISLDSAPAATLIGFYLGYVRTTGSLYSYNCNSSHWYSMSYTGLPRGEETAGTTSVFWSTTGCYGISTVWAQWREQDWANGGETPLGGHAAWSVATVWTNQNAYGYSAGNGQWSAQPLPTPPISGLAEDGLALVWTPTTAYAFTTSTGGWIPTSLNNPLGISADGSGDVALVWTDSQAQAFSNIIPAWYPLQETEPFVGGSASGEVAVVWTVHKAHAFNSQTAEWIDVNLNGLAGVPETGPDPAGAFRLGPNPMRGEPLTVSLPAGGPWKLEIIGVGGTRIRSLQSPSSPSGASLIWDGRDDQGHAAAAGTYWVRAEAGSRVEARRIVLLR